MVISGVALPAVAAVGVLVAAFVLISLPNYAEALTWQERLEQLRAEADARRAQYNQSPENNNSENNQNEPENVPVVIPESGQEPCSCSASVKFDKPDLQWSGGSLVFVPRFDVSVRVRDNESAGPWNLDLNYSGDTSYSSDNMSVPPGVGFAGSDSWAGACVDTRFNFRGHAGAPVTLTGVLRSLFTQDKEMEGVIKMNADLTGCDSDNEYRQFRFRIEEFGNLKPNGWRSVR